MVGRNWREFSLDMAATGAGFISSCLRAFRKTEGKFKSLGYDRSCIPTFAKRRRIWATRLRIRPLLAPFSPQYLFHPPQILFRVHPNRIERSLGGVDVHAMIQEAKLLQSLAALQFRFRP